MVSRLHAKTNQIGKILNNLEKCNHMKKEVENIRSPTTPSSVTKSILNKTSPTSPRCYATDNAVDYQQQQQQQHPQSNNQQQSANNLQKSTNNQQQISSINHNHQQQSNNVIQQKSVVKQLDSPNNNNKQTRVENGAKCKAKPDKREQSNGEVSTGESGEERSTA